MYMPNVYTPKTQQQELRAYQLRLAIDEFTSRLVPLPGLNEWEEEGVENERFFDILKAKDVAELQEIISR